MKPPKEKQDKNYYTKETDEAIQRYLNEPDPYKKDLIYQDYIHYPFFKICENMVNRFKYYNSDESDIINDIMKDGVTHLTTVMVREKYDPVEALKTGKSGFGYWSTVAKFYFMGKSIIRQKHDKRNQTIVDDNIHADEDGTNHHSMVLVAPSKENDMVDVSNGFCAFLNKKIETAKTNQEREIIKAVIETLNGTNEIVFKDDFYARLRQSLWPKEFVNGGCENKQTQYCKTQRIARVMKQIRAWYGQYKMKYLAGDIE